MSEHQNERHGVVGYVPGAYDMFHIGHLNILRRAKEHCDYLIAGVVTDEVMLSAKGKPPVVPHEERMEIVAAISCVDEVVTDVSSDKLVMWKLLGFDVLFKGDDWKGTPKGDRLEASMAEVGVQVVYFPYTAHTSSTLLRALISGNG
jgi:glycerol-3-phosphate cytidylyltransferase